MIELVHVQKSFGDVTPLRDVNATINEGDIIGVIGPSGCGKSTLLRCINLLDPPTGGQIFVDGEDITAPGYDVTRLGSKMGMVFQKFNLFGHWTVVENVMNPQVMNLGRTRQEAYDKAMALLRKVGLAQKALAFPAQLSGGQQQRVAIARTLAMDPEIILLDEPTSALDPAKVGEVEEVIRALAEAGRTMMIVTHEMRLAREVANRIFYMDEGGLYEEGTPEQVFEHPRREKTRSFVKRLKSAEFDIESRDFDFLGVVASIDAYCAKLRLPADLARRAQVVFEELCVSMVLPQLPAGDVRLRFVLEWNEAKRRLYAMVKYNGPLHNPEGSDELAWPLVAGNVERFAHMACEEEPFTNKVEIVFCGTGDGGLLHRDAIEQSSDAVCSTRER